MPNIFIFEGIPLEIVKEYKYLGIDFYYKLSWETFNVLCCLTNAYSKGNYLPYEQMLEKTYQVCWKLDTYEN